MFEKKRREQRIDELEKNLPLVFTPSAPVSTRELLKGRDEILEALTTAYTRKGGSIVLYGERGVGKTSIAKVVRTCLTGDHYYYSASRDDSFESIMQCVLQHYGTAFSISERQQNTVAGHSGKIGIPGVAEGSAADSHLVGQVEIPLTQTVLTPQLVASRLPRDPCLIIVDDFERIENRRSKAQFADLVKKLSDNDVPSTLMVVGIGQNLDTLLAAHESCGRSIIEIKAPMLTDGDIREVVVHGMQRLDLSIEEDCVDQIVGFSRNFPYYTHLLCEGAIRSLLQRLKQTQCSPEVCHQDIIAAVDFAIRNAERSISTAYDEAVQNFKGSDRFKLTLYAIASWPREPVQYREICEWVGKILKAHNNTVNLSHQLGRLENARVIEKVSKGMYRFRNPLLKAFVILKLRSDQPEHQLTAIDAQLSDVKKQLDRVNKGLPGKYN